MEDRTTRSTDRITLTYLKQWLNSGTKYYKLYQKHPLRQKTLKTFFCCFQVLNKIIVDLDSIQLVKPEEAQFKLRKIEAFIQLQERCEVVPMIRKRKAAWKLTLDQES